jgi:hypothetical protein
MTWMRLHPILNAAPHVNLQGDSALFSALDVATAVSEAHVASKVLHLPF